MTFARLALPDAPPGTAVGACAACGTDTTTGHPVPWSSNFVAVDQLAVPRSSVVCAPCAALLGNSPLRSAKASGRPLGWRMFSLLARAGHPLAYAHKGAKRTIRAWLLAAPYPEPWGCVVADSGKKQLAPWAPVNPGGVSPWRIQFETLIVPWDAAGLAAHLARVEAAYALGIPKVELLSGAWSVGRLRTLQGDDLAAALAHEHALRPLCNSPQHALAVWLAQRPDEDAADEEVSDGSEQDDA